MSQQTLSIIVPCFNEEGSLDELASQIRNTLISTDKLYELIIVDDGSSDHSWATICRLQIQYPEVKGVRLSRNFGQQAAILAGLTQASGDIIVTMDSDLQDPPSLIPEMIKAYNNGFPIVYARRKKREHDPLLKRIFATLFYSLVRRVTRMEIPSNVGEFRLVGRKVLDAVLAMNEERLFFRGMFAWVGFPHTFVYYDRPKRFAGEPKFTFRSSLALAVDAFTSFSVYRLGSILAGFAAAINGVLLAGISLATLMDLVQIKTAFTLVMICLSLLFMVSAILLLANGVIIQNKKNRPKYIIDRTVGFTSSTMATVQDIHQRVVGM